MSVASYVLGVVAALLVLFIVIEMLRRRRLRERHALWWLVLGVLALVAGVFPSTLVWAAHLVGVQVPTNLTFFVSLAILFLVCLQHAAELTTVEAKARTLAEQLAMQDLRIRELERQLNGTDRLSAEHDDT